MFLTVQKVDVFTHILMLLDYIFILKDKKFLEKLAKKAYLKKLQISS